jgi:hypothetical protein
VGGEVTHLLSQSGIQLLLLPLAGAAGAPAAGWLDPNGHHPPPRMLRRQWRLCLRRDRAMRVFSFSENNKKIKSGEL